MISQGRNAVSEGILGVIFTQLLIYSMFHNVHVPHVALGLGDSEIEF